MKETLKVERPRGRKTTGPSPRGGRIRKGAKTNRFSPETRLKAVKLCLEEQMPRDQICQLLGCGKSTLGKWLREYRDHGEEGLKTQRPGGGRVQVSSETKGRIVEYKKQHPDQGSRTISNFFKRLFCVDVSHETVRQTLKEEDLIEKPKRKPKRNPSKPRRFERSTPNQMWQSDIMSFRLAGRNAYLIGYIDDYSRFITGLGLFRSQTAEHVLEVYRKAIAEYGLPKEMLTDNGRQYVNWRGVTRFEKELKKDRIKHFRSRPQHPMTLGKIERFWKTIFSDFLERAQFGSFEEAQERISKWVQYYNHRRPHQGIGGLCPADRYFEISHELKKTLEAGIEENVLEQALRGKPKDPFYMVGRMGEQSVVIRAEKGKVKMLVDSEGESRELEYQMEKADESECKQSEEKGAAEESGGVQCEAEVRGRALGLDGASEAERGVQGASDRLGTAQPVGGSGAQRDVGGSGAATAQGVCETTGVECEAGETAGESGEERGTEAEQTRGTSGTTGGLSAAEEAFVALGLLGTLQEPNGRCDEADRCDPQLLERGVERAAGSAGAEGECSDLPQVGETGVISAGGLADAASGRQAEEAGDRSAEAGTEESASGVGETDAGDGSSDGNQRPSFGWF